MEKVHAFKAKDGTLFDTEEMACEHEVSLQWQARISEFSRTKECPYPSGAQNGMMRKIIVGWELFKTKATQE